jgi:CheY-like chemotaxis protein/signal transduction histidine kinase
MLGQTKITTRLLLGFSMLLLAALFLGVLGASSIRSLSALTDNIFKHPFTVTTSILEVRSDLLLAQRLLANLVHTATPGEVDMMERRLLAQQQRNDANMALVRERFLGNKGEVDQVDRALREWRAARDEIIGLMRDGRRAEALGVHGGRGALLGDTALKEITDVADFAAYRAAAFKDAAEEEGSSALWLIAATLLVMAAGVALAGFVTRNVKTSLRSAAGEVQHATEGIAEKAAVAEAISTGDLNRAIPESEPLEIDLARVPNDELGALLKAAVQLSTVQLTLDQAFRNMVASLRAGRETASAADWLKTGLNELNELMRGDQTPSALAEQVLSYLTRYLHAAVAALYLFDAETEELTLAGTYAFTRRKNLADRFRLGEGLIGQAARERKTICLTSVPADYLPVSSALGDAAPQAIAAMPLIHNANLVGAIEIGTFRKFSDAEFEFLDLAAVAIAIELSATLSSQRTAELLRQTQQQAEELRVQQEELQQSNEELEERAQLLEQQRESIRVKNEEIERAAESLRQKAVELERVSTYKSEFLANMSHELRTPLNSLMILSSLLMQNKEENLTAKQVEFATTINAAGSDLLHLINDILDLSKVEAGQMHFQSADIVVQDLCDALRSLFDPQAEQKGLTFSARTEDNVPATFRGDEQRVHQILKNLLANAIKFTESGSVELRVFTPSLRDNPLPVEAIAFAISDTGIGIPLEKQEAVFQAFQQADGSISRRYGGTGLGLSISQQLALHMNGDIRLASTPGKGSVFTLYLPVVATAEAAPGKAAPAALRPAPKPAPVREAAGENVVPFRAPAAGDRPELAAGEKSILLIEDDAKFAAILENMVQERGFAVLSARDGDTGLALAERHLPSAIILDVMLPNLDGWGVMRRLKDNPRTRHIPVHFITCLDERQKAMAMGAIGFVTKPVDTRQLNEVFEAIEDSVAKSVRKLLIVEDDAAESASMVALLEERGVEITVASTGKEAIEVLSTQAFDCVVLDIGLTDMSGFELLDRMQDMGEARRTPVIVHSGRDLSHEDERTLRRYAESIIIKGAMSPERLLNEVALFLHLVESKLHPSKQRMIRSALDKEAMLDGRKVLLVDDDMRNIFSLTSVLADKNMIVVEAENGLESIARLEEHPDVSIVLMDIMMPEMDGYTAIREIRKDERFASLPIIAMTAKALKGDYEKCMAAGASDYIAKPIEVDKLLSLIRVWMFQQA